MQPTTYADAARDLILALNVFVTMVARLGTRGYTNVLLLQDRSGLREGSKSGPACLGGYRVQESGVRNGAYGADKFGFKELAAVHWNLTEPALYEHAIAAGEGSIVTGLSLIHISEPTRRTPI